MSKDAWYRKIYGYGIGTGYYYPDGEEVKVGDLVEVPNTEKVGTIRIRSDDGKKQRPYVTWWEGVGSLRTMALSKLNPIIRCERKSYGNHVPIVKKKGPAFSYKGKGEVIVGLEDYDHAIIVKV